MTRAERRSVFRRVHFLLLVPLVVCGCATTSVASPSATSTPRAASPSAATASAASPSPSASASATEACIDQETLDLLVENLGTIETLSTQQRGEIAAALRAHDFGTDETALSWRDTVVEALEAGGYTSQPNRDLVMVQFASGQIAIEACP